MPTSMFSLPRHAGDLLSGRGKKRKLQILIYHRVLENPDPLQPSEPSVTTFDWQMRVLKDHFNVLSLEEALARMAAGQLPPRAACVTFDDGYADNLTLAQPILYQYEIPATVYVATDYLDGGIMFNDAVLECVKQFRQDYLDLSWLGAGETAKFGDASERLASFALITGLVKYLPISKRNEAIGRLIEDTSATMPENLMLSSSQLSTLADSGIEIGAHTASHPILATLNETDARKEIIAGRDALRERLDKDIRFFAYPNGVPDKDFNDTHMKMLPDLGFECAVSTSHGVSDSYTNIYSLKRFTPWDKSPGRFLTRLLRNYL